MGIHCHVQSVSMDNDSGELTAVERLREAYPAWDVFRIAGGWGAILRDAERARTGNSLEELEGKLKAYTQA
jgi:hypothetical protein